MTPTSHFSFIKEKILRENLQITFNHILILIQLSKSTGFDEDIKGSFKKTIIINTASIIEALLYYLLKNSITEEKLIKKIKVFKVTKEVYSLNNADILVIGKYNLQEKIILKKLNLEQLNNCCLDFELVKKDLTDEISKVRELRNKQHLATLPNIDNLYSDLDLEYVFSVARKVKKIVKDAKI